MCTLNILHMSPHDRTLAYLLRSQALPTKPTFGTAKHRYINVHVTSEPTFTGAKEKPASAVH